MPSFRRKKKATAEAKKYQPQLRNPKRYLCTAKYTSETGDTRYLIRELISKLPTEDLKEPVIEIFLKDLETPSITKKLDKESENQEDRKRKRLIYLRGKLENLVIEELGKKEELKK